jgi:hypothetical protein
MTILVLLVNVFMLDHKILFLTIENYYGIIKHRLIYCL